MAEAKKPLVLIAEDSEETSRLIAFSLEKNGFEVLTYANGLDAYERLKAEPRPDLLITDNLMPGMTGFELLSRLKTDGIQLPVIFLAAQKNEEDVMRGLSGGALDFIAKPFSPREMVARVKATLARRG